MTYGSQLRKYLPHLRWGYARHLSGTYDLTYNWLTPLRCWGHFGIKELFFFIFFVNLDLGNWVFSLFFCEFGFRELWFWISFSILDFVFGLVVYGFRFLVYGFWFVVFRFLFFPLTPFTSFGFGNCFVDLETSVFDLETCVFDFVAYRERFSRGLPHKSQSLEVVDCEKFLYILL